MLDLIETRRDEIAALCRRFHVRRLEVFGSAARGADFDPARSDVDFLVAFTDHPDALSFRTYFGLKWALEELLGRPVDLVVEKAVENPYMKAGMNRSREPVFAA